MSIPSDVAKRKRIKEALIEAEKVHVILDSAKQALKDISDRVKDELDMKPADFNKILKVWIDEARQHEVSSELVEALAEVEILKNITLDD